MISTLSRPAAERIAPKKSGIAPLLRIFPLLAATICISLSIGTAAHAQTLAGTSINNQAAISYTDESGSTQNATSNPISTLVQQVSGVALVSDNTKNAANLARVNFPHTVTNTGNGTDTFSLSAVDQTGDGFNISPAIYADADGNGVPDSLIPLLQNTTGPLAPGASFSFVVSGTVPILVTGNARVLVTATSAFNSGTTLTNTDIVNQSNGAAIEVVKEIDVNSGLAGTGPYTYTLRYTNTSNTAGTNLLINDSLPLGVTYISGSGLWSGSATALNDATGSNDPAGVNYSYDAGILVRKVTATISNVPANSSGTLKFKVNIDSGLLPQIIPNVATYRYDGMLPLLFNTTNVVNLTTLQLGAVTYIAGPSVALAPQNTTVTFTNLVTNVGTGNDTFNMTFGTINSFPVGTTFVFYKSDGVTPLADSNNDNIPDTGSIGPLGTYAVIVKATLPANAQSTIAMVRSSTATSIFDPSKSATASNILVAILNGSVDLTNNALGTLGAGIGPETDPVTTLLADLLPNSSTTRTFDLYVKNGSAAPDNFDLSASAGANFSPIVNFPAGVNVVFKTTAGAIITNTGTIAPNAQVHIIAEVTLPAGTPAGLQNVYFRVLSQVTGLTDIKHDGISITSIRGLSLTPNNNGQTFKGGSVVYTHILSNNSLLPEGGNTLLSTIDLTTTNSATGFTSVIYRDTNANGIFDPADQVVTDINPALASSLLPGASTTLFVKVTAPTGGSIGAQNTTTLTATTTGGLLPPAPVSATDLTTVLSSQLTFEKSQALDTNGDGTPDGAYSQNQLTTGAIPGRVIRYKIVVTNTGTAAVSNAVVTDAIPAHTVYDTGDGTDAGDGTPDAASWFNGTTRSASTNPPTNGGTGTLRFEVGTIAPGQVITITFGVKIQ